MMRCSEGCCVAVWKERELHKRELNYFLRSRRANHIIIFRRICSSRSGNGQHKMMVSTVLSLYLHRRKCVPRLLDFANRVSLNRGRRVGSLHSSAPSLCVNGFSEMACNLRTRLARMKLDMPALIHTLLLILTWLARVTDPILL